MRNNWQPLALPTIGQPLERKADTWTPDGEIDHFAKEIGAVVLVQRNVIHVR